MAQICYMEKSYCYLISYSSHFDTNTINNTIITLYSNNNFFLVISNQLYGHTIQIIELLNMN